MKKHAVLIGIDKYRQSPLYKCVYDQERLKEYLTSEGFSISFLSNENCTRENVANEINESISGLRFGDIFWMSFSGHGSYTWNRTGEEKYDSTICLHDGDVIDNDIGEWAHTMSDNGILSYLVFDCCHSGGNSRVLMESDAKIKSLPPVEDAVPLSRSVKHKEILIPDESVFIQACQGDEVALEFNDGGVFTTELLKCICKNKKYDLIQVINEVVFNVRKRTRNKQTPNIECREKYKYCNWLENPEIETKGDVSIKDVFDLFTEYMKQSGHQL